MKKCVAHLLETMYMFKERKMFTKKTITKSAGLFLALSLLLPAFSSPGTMMPLSVEGESTSTEAIEIHPDTELEYTDDELSPEERDALIMRHLELREQYAALVDNHVDDPSGAVSEDDVEPIELGDPYEESEAYLKPSSSFIMASRKNTRFNSGVNYWPPEPAAINEGKLGFMMGNTHAEESIDWGTSWTNVPLPGGPSDAPFLIGDPDVVNDPGRGLTIYSMLYVNSAVTNGVVRLYVRRRADRNTVCSYTIDPAGASNNTLPDYPHLGLSNNYLYLSTNNLGGAAGSRAQVYRLGLEALGNCTSAGGSLYQYTWTYGQRVFVPVEGAQETMYWGAMYDSNDFRVYKWPDNSSTASSWTRPVATATFANPDCRGGVGNYDFIEKSTAWSIAGFRMRGAVGKQGILFLTNVANDASHPHAYEKAVLIRESDMMVIGQPTIWSTSYCVGYPALSANRRGDFGLATAYGGKKGGGGNAAQAAVSIDDEWTSGAGRFNSLYRTAYGTHNRSDGRFGDYFTIHPNQPVGLMFTATGYALNGGTAVSNVNARYVQFGRGRDSNSLWRWRAPKDL